MPRRSGRTSTPAQRKLSAHTSADFDDDDSGDICNRGTSPVVGGAPPPLLPRAAVERLAASGWPAAQRTHSLPPLLTALFPGSGVRAVVPVTAPPRWLRATAVAVETGSPTAAPIPVTAVSSAAHAGAADGSDVVFVPHGTPVRVRCPLTLAAIPPTQLCRNVHECGHYYNHAALSGMLQQRRNRAKANARHSDPLDLARAHSFCPVAACESKLVSLSDVEMV